MITSRAVPFFALSMLLALDACGGSDAERFDACGGSAVGAWELESATLASRGAGDGCPSDGDASGALFLNADGRYSVMATIRGWKKSPGEACGFTTAFGGFYRVDGARICFGDSSATGSAIPCGEVQPTSQHAVADYCVEKDHLRLRSSDLLFLREPASFELTRRAVD